MADRIDGHAVIDDRERVERLKKRLLVYEQALQLVKELAMTRHRNVPRRFSAVARDIVARAEEAWPSR